MSTFKEFLKQKFNETRFGILLKKSLEQNTIDTEWRDTIVYDPLNEKRVYEIGKKYEENFFPNGLKNSPLEKPVDYGPDQSIPDKRGSSGAKKYAALFAKHHKPETDILLKPAANISAAEIEKARRFSMFENNNPQLGKEIDAANQTATGRQWLSSFDGYIEKDLK